MRLGIRIPHSRLISSKCYGSTSVSKTLRSGSIPGDGAYMTLSVVIPTYTTTKELEDLAASCAGFYSDNPDVRELIICEDGGMFSPTLFQLSDVYLHNKTNSGFTKNVNNGIRIAKGDFIAIVNSDTQIAKSKTTGTLKDLCVPGKVTSPITVDGSFPGIMCGHYFVVPRAVFEARGILDERFHTMCSDADFEDRIKDIFEVVSSVQIYHEMNVTLNATNYLKENSYIIESDKELFSQVRKQRFVG